MDLSGTTIGQYQLISQLGLGGMATVYKARQPSLDRYVAIKILKADLAKSSGFVARFEREARTIARLRHRNILTIFEYGHEEDMFYLVMEYVAGGTLKERLGWPQDLGEAVNIVSQVGNALAHAHRQGMIHRDVKPGNVLMVEEDWPLLSDFGLAKMVEDSLHLTLSGASVGTPQYMSPEQAQSLPVDRRSDIYSLGVLLYEAVTGQPPFGFDSPMAVILKHINDPVTPPHQLRSDLPDDMERVILKALTKDPDSRYQRMEDFVADLQTAATHNLSRGKRLDPPPSPGPVASSGSYRLPTRRKSSRSKTVLRLLTLLAVILTLLLYRNQLTPLVAMLSNAITAGLTNPGAATAVSPTPLAPTSTAVSGPTPTFAPTFTAVAPVTPTFTPPAPTATPTPLSPTPQPPASPTPAPFKPQIRVSAFDGAEMVFVPAGEFTMGSDQLGDDEKPAHPVNLADFWLDRYEVTNERFSRFVAAASYKTDAEKAGWGWVNVSSDWEEVKGADWRHPRGPNSSIEGKMNHPVVLVSWNDADAYCRWAGKRLPSEAEWEKAAGGAAYPWGDKFDKTKANTKESALNDTAPVGSFSPAGDSPYGAADLTGNAWEWVGDWYDAAYYQASPPANPPGPAKGAAKVLRGGSWLFDEVYGRAAFRHNLKPEYMYDFTGFRCSSQ